MNLLKYISLCLLVTTLTACGLLKGKSNGEIEAVLQIAKFEDLSEAKSILNTRLEKYGENAKVKEISGNKIKVEVLGKANPDEVRDLLTSSAKLDFYKIIPNQEFKKIVAEALEEKYTHADSLLELFHFVRFDGVPTIGSALSKDTLAVNQFFQTYLTSELNDFSNNEQKLLWGVEDKNGIIPLYFMKTENSGNPFLTFKKVKKAFQQQNYNNRTAVAIELNPEDAKRWENFTAKAYKENFQFAITIEENVYSAVGVMARIEGGRFEIAGDFSIEEAQKLAKRLELGYLPEVELLSFDAQPLK